MERSYRWYVGMTLLAGHMLALFVGLVGLVSWHISPPRAFDEARERWQANPVPHYRLIIDRPMLNCQQDVEIQHERIIPGSGHNTCPIRSLTVTDLFNRVARLDGMENFEFLSNHTGCFCESELHATVVYDPNLGYPTRVGIADRRVVDWQDRSCWRYILMNGTLPECEARVFFGQPRITTITLNPLPETGHAAPGSGLTN